MRINVYSQELTKEVKVISKRADDTGIVYHGVRMYLASPDILHQTLGSCKRCGYPAANERHDDCCPDGEEHQREYIDDDRSAITFWIPNAESFTKDDLATVFRAMADAVDACPDPERND